MDKQSAEIRRFLLERIGEHPHDIAKVAASAFGISRQAINRHLRSLAAEGAIVAEGETRGRRYALRVEDTTHHLPLSSELQEDKVWRDVAARALAGLPSNVLGICHYGFTEMVNNAVDHSEGDRLVLTVQRSAAWVKLRIGDDGIGIFKKIKNAFDLDDERHAILELAKGKLTTDPRRHSGEGIFFTSRMFDDYSILSGTLFFCHTRRGTDWLVEDVDFGSEGTLVEMQIGTASERTVQEVFDRFTAESDDYGFTRTQVPVFLAKYGDENLVSRSQAKRLLARFERFREVWLDFEGITVIGQAFADEIFRVFQRGHPDTHIRWINAGPAVQRMIQRALSNETG